MLSLYQHFIHFYGWIIFWYMDIPHFIYPISWWTVGLFLPFSWIILLLAVMYRLLCGCIFSILLGTYLGVELLDHTVILYLTFWRTAKLFSKVSAHVQFCNGAKQTCLHTGSSPLVLALVLCCPCLVMLALHFCKGMLPTAWNTLHNPFSRLCLPGL